MRKELSKKEKYDRMAEWRNVKKLHKQARDRVIELEGIVKGEQEKIAQLLAVQEADRKEIEELRRQLEELRVMVFGKKKEKSEMDDEDLNDTPLASGGGGGKVRSKESYQRSVPKEEEITQREEKRFVKPNCTKCTTELVKVETKVYYTEDIVLPHEQLLKTITETKIERGWCRPCGKWRYAETPPNGKVVLGRKVKIYVCYLSILLRLSFSQIQLHLSVSYNFTLSDGEIARVLQQEARRLRPEYEKLKENIRNQAGVHEDETSWNVQKEENGNHAWVMTGTETDDVVFACGQSRGAGVARELTGESTAVGITDDYALYHNVFTDKHQLCIAHPFRKLRDLATSKVFDIEVHQHCVATFHKFGAMYQELQAALAQPFDFQKNNTIRSKLLKKLTRFSKPNPLDPEQLTKIKTRLSQTKAKYLTCLQYENIPPDNNKAERALRHLVLKRKISFGSKSQSGANATAILASILLSSFRSPHSNFFSRILSL